ncbi:MAG TPA: DUF6036 family nucleotidyltransferase [Solirubrobacteraceae bacterium]
MRAYQFEHVLAAAAQITGQDEFVVIGSQAILGSHSEPPEELLQSMEADLYPLNDPEAADLIDGALGDGSPFQAAFGYYAHGVGPETAKAPAGWQGRLVRWDIQPRPGSDLAAVAWCLEAHDLVLAKCAAGRDRDWEYAREAIRAGVVQGEVLLARVHELPLPTTQLGHIETMLRGIVPTG